MKEKITKADIETLTDELVRLLIKHNLAMDVCLYFNGDQLDLTSHFDPRTHEWGITPVRHENVNPHNYFECAAYHHILSMSFEGPLYRYIDRNCGFPSDVEELFEEYGIWYELGNAWNMTFYPANDAMEIEYTEYRRPDPVETIYFGQQGIPGRLEHIMQVWYDMSTHYGDHGSCVIGAGMKFDFHGMRYKMDACSPYQGSLSWESGKDIVEKMLEAVGCTNIAYDWGTMD